MSDPSEEETVELSARDALNATAWDVIRNVYVRCLSGGEIPRNQHDRNELVRPYFHEMKADHAAIVACMDQAVMLEAGALVAGLPMGERGGA